MAVVAVAVTVRRTCMAVIVFDASADDLRDLPLNALMMRTVGHTKEIRIRLVEFGRLV